VLQDGWDVLLLSRERQTSLKCSWIYSCICLFPYVGERNKLPALLSRKLRLCNEEWQVPKRKHELWKIT
jgi:hypothetical protein